MGYWKTKPPPGVRPNLQHPLGRGMISCLLCNEGGGIPQDSVYQQVPDTSGIAFAWSAGWLGRLARSNHSATFPNYKLNSSIPPPPVTVITSVLMGPVSGSNSYFSTASPTDSSYSAWNFGHINTINFLQVTFGTGATQIIGATPLAAGQLLTAAFTFDGTSALKLYRDGYLDGSATAAVNAARSLATVISPLVRLSGGASNPFAYYSYMYNRCLSPAEIAAVTFDPYQMIQAPFWAAPFRFRAPAANNWLWQRRRRLRQLQTI